MATFKEPVPERPPEVRAPAGKLKSIASLFPQPRVTLNELSSKLPDKVFDIHYKQSVSTPKGGRKKKNKRIDKNGHPVYDRDKIEEIKSTLNEPFTASISENSMESVKRVWEEYEGGIRDVFEKTHKEAMGKIMKRETSLLRNDSTIDSDDDVSEAQDINENTQDVTNTTELRTPVHPVYGKPVAAPSRSALERRQMALERTFQFYKREITPLPIDEYAETISQTLQSHRSAILVGAAGCGKSTRAPAAILNSVGSGVRAIVSGPRKVAAVGLASRVAKEMGEDVGETIGYQVRLDSRPPRPPAGSVLYCTSGVLLRRLQNDPGLHGCTHVFIDEAHERDVNTDITLCLLKRALDLNEELRVVVMSATLDIDVFTKYFDNCPVIEVPGRTYPVEVTYLEDLQSKLGNVDVSLTLQACERDDGRPNVHCNEIANVVKAIDKTQPEGAILVFLPGWHEIKTTHQLLTSELPEATHMVLPVHSRLPLEEQTKIFTKPLPGIRKIVLATNIAETSLTIPDAVYVVDSGAHKENRIKEGTGMSSLQTVWVSLASAQQRTGRAGRVQPGHCYRLYTKEKEKQFSPHTAPEILRVPLEQTVLDCKSYAPDVKVADFLSQLPEPPTQKAIDFALNDLIDLGALTPTEQLTPLGRTLSNFTLPARAACSLLHSTVMYATATALNIAARQCDKSALVTGNNDIREYKKKYHPTSDHIALHCIQDEYETILEEDGYNAAMRWCEREELRRDGLEYSKALAKIHATQLINSGMFHNSEIAELNRFVDVDCLSIAGLLSGSNSLLVAKRSLRTKGKLATVKEVFTSTGDRAHISSNSVNKDIVKLRSGAKPDLLCYFEGRHSTERRAVVLNDTSLVTTHMALLFCKGQVTCDEIQGSHNMSVIRLPRHRLNIEMPTEQAELLLKSREMIWSTFQYYFDRDTRSLDEELLTLVSMFRLKLVKAIGRILVEAENEQNGVSNYSCDENTNDDDLEDIR
ncbi:unnamed protein product [Plutella xylostella]|uniref:(diamondback moth) hypothetical protein n=1 Tax=Plutella xylostella TaxID=51655 RepID=A0A8S4F1V2_PLUXY|nr:unnamed protein product [Plutella xylostella]